MGVHAFQEHVGGLSWVMDDSMRRTSHALLDDGGGVWLIDPVEDPAAMERVQALGTPVAVLQLLDRHNRDCSALADRLAIPLHRLPRSLPQSPFEVISVIQWRRWREIALYWRERDLLVVAEAVGTAPLFALGGAVGVHPVLRVAPPRALEGLTPLVLLVGHGPALQSDAAEGLRVALERSRSDIPRLLLSLPAAIRQRL
ncbi:MAG TPA: hypothetical protein VID48_07620 [Solirubrobacteraceae bacterium]|jgi:hypothetical protein